MSNKSLQTEWVDNVAALLPKLKPCDRLETRFGSIGAAVRHMSIYVGNGDIVDVWGNNGPFDKNAKVRCASLSDPNTFPRENFSVRINNALDNQMSPDNENKILERAFSKVGSNVDYNVTKNNCEHFTNYCRYGQHRSTQIGEKIAAGSHGSMMGALSGFELGKTFGPWGAAIGAVAGSSSGSIGSILQSNANGNGAGSSAMFFTHLFEAMNKKHDN